MRNTFKRLFSLFLSFVMAFGMLSEVSANELQKYQSLSRSKVSSFVDDKGKLAFADNVINEDKILTVEDVVVGENVDDSEIIEGETTDGSEIIEGEITDGSEIIEGETTDGSEIIEGETTNGSEIIEGELTNEETTIVEDLENNNLTKSAVVTDDTFVGEGNESSPFIIDSLEKMLYVTSSIKSIKTIKGVASASAFYKLESDIDLSTTTDFLGIGTDANIFKGNFDGNGHTVNLKMQSGNSYVGLFPRLDSATIKNITVSGSVSAYEHVGGIAGIAVYDTVIENCINKADIKGGRNIGGVAGVISTNVKIENCYNYGNIVGNECVGGITGILRNKCIIINSENNGVVTGSGYYTGGITAQMQAGSLISECQVMGTVTGNHYVGGITAYLSASTISKSNVIADVTGNANVAGISGVFNNNADYEITDNSLIEDCLITGKVTGNSNVIGIIVGTIYTNGYLKIKNTYYKNTEGTNSFSNAMNSTSIIIEDSGYYISGNITPKDAQIIINGLPYDESLIERNGNDFLLKLKINKNQNERIPELDKISFKKSGYITKEVSLDKFSAGYVTLENDENAVVTEDSFVGEGSEGSPFIIDSLEKMLYITASIKDIKTIKGVVSASAFYKLESDIDLRTTVEFLGIGTDANNFKGNFDGNGHTVNLNIQTNTDYIGLFRKVDNAIIKNVAVAGGVSGVNYVSGIVASATNNTVIENCKNEATIKGINKKTAGIVAYASGKTKIENAYNSGNITGYEDTGGIVAYVDNVIITKSVNSGVINGSWYNCGSIAGEILNRTIISECEAREEGEIIGVTYVGGIVGVMRNSTVSDCNIFANMSGYNRMGGVAGICINNSIDTPSLIDNCLITGEVISKISGSYEWIGIIIGLTYGGAGYTTIKNTYYTNDKYTNLSGLNFFYDNKEDIYLVIENSGYYVKGNVTPKDATILINGVAVDEKLIERNGNEFLLKVQLDKIRDQSLKVVEKIAFKKTGYETKEIYLSENNAKKEYNFNLGEITLKKGSIENDTTNPISKPGYNKTTLVGEETEFDGSQSTDNDEIATYDWDFGDGKTATGVKVKHTYENAGEYKVTLKVKDITGNEDSKSITVQVFEQSQTGTIIIKVIDQETKAPIPNASVYIDFPDNPSLVVTDTNGTVNIVGEPGNYNFSAYKKNYLPKEQNEKITQYKTTNATIALEKSEVAVGEVVTRPLNIEEIKELGIDTTAPENQHIYSYTVTLEFGKEKIEMPKIIVNGTTGSSIGSGSWDFPSLPSKPSNFQGSVYPNVIPVPDHPEIPPTLLILKISSEVSFLKEFFEVAVIMQNMADYQFIMKDSKVTLELPEGLSLADTGVTQEFEQNLGDIAGGQVEFASWIVRGDKVGDYDLSADFKAMLMPFKAPVSATFKTGNTLKVKGAEGLKIYVNPEPVAHPGEPYYVKFTLANESEREFYNVKTSFNTEDGTTPTPRKRTIMTDQGAIELNQSYFNYLLDYIEDQKNLPILEDGDSFEIKVLKPHESISGTYTAILNDGDDPEKIIYKLTKAFSQTNEGSTVEIPVVFNETPLHVSGNPNDAPIKWDFDSNGIDLATGANIVDVSTVNVFGVKDIPFKLKNNSMDLEKGRFGQGWSSNYDLNVKPQEDGALLVYTSNTSYIRFVNDNAKKGIINGNIKDSSVQINSTELLGTYSCLTTNYQRYKLTKELDRYFVTDDKGNSYYFNNEGKLNQTKDKKGRTLEVSSEDKKITVKEKSTNKQIQTTSNDEGYITKIADNTGKESTLTYNEAGQIETITNAVGDKTRYEYDPEGRLIRQMINNSDVMTIKYDELGRVVSKTDAMGESITYSYDTKSEFWRTLINITDRNGNTEKIKADWRGHIVANKNALEEETYFTYNRYGDMTSVRDALGNSSIYEYDKEGNLLKTEDAEGILETMTYDSHGNVLTHEMQNGSKTINTYNDTNLLTSTTNERGVTATFTYNEDGQVITKTVEELGTLHYTYNSGKLATETDFLGNVTLYEYDSTGNLIKNTDPEGNITSYKYDATNRLIETTTADNATTGFKYDDRDNIIEIIDPLKKVTKQTFDPNNRLIKVIDTMSQTTEYEYDKERNLIKGTNPNGGVFTYVYDKVYRQIETEDAESGKVGYTYDKVGRLKTKTLYNDGKDAKYSYEYYRNGSLKAETDPLGNTTKYNYNNVGQLSEVTNAKGKKTWYEYDNSNNLLWIKDAENNKTSYEYDKFSRQIQVTDPKGNKTKLEYNEANLVKSNIDALNNKTQNIYDKNGNVIKTIDKLGHENKISYDKVGRVKSITNALGNTVSTEYDLYGNVISLIDSYGVKVVETKYNALGSPIESKDALGNTNKAEYNEMQEVITKIDALNESNKYIYNKVGKLLKTTDPEEGVTSFTYDKLGNMLTFTDAMGSKTELEYDLSGNLTKQKMATGGEKLYAYDELNRIKTFTNGRGQELVYKYTDSNRLENGAGIEYTYDENGNILTVKDANGTTIRTYDELNRVTSFTDVNGNKIGYIFDAVGNLKELHYPTGEVVYYNYDEANQLKEVKDYAGRITKYDYNKNGQLIKTERPDGSVESITYDAIGRMTEKKDIGGVLGTGNGNNTGKRIVLNHYTYEYNGLGNIVKENDLSDDEKVSKEYAYENTNNLQAFTKMTYGKGNQLVSYDGKEVKYDSDGNMVSGPLKGSFVNYEYDKFNRLVKVGSTEYRYDGENTRISKETKASDTKQNNSNTNNNDTTKLGKTTYITDPNASISRLLISINPDGSKVIYVYGLGLISQEHTTATTVQSPNPTKIYSLFHYDYRGSTTVITNQKSEITDVITYDAYGGISGRKGNTDTLFLYVGQQGVQTDDNGLYYMRGRYYNTDIHRFINLDPINDGLNWYGYVNGNPVMNVDPSGNSAMDSAQILTDLGFNARDIGVAVGGLVSVIITGEVLIVVGLVAAVVFIGYATLHGNPTVMAEAWDFKFTKVLSGGYIGDVWVHDTGQEYWVQTGGNEFTAGAKFDGQNVYYPDSPNDPNGKKPKGSGRALSNKVKRQIETLRNGGEVKVKTYEEAREILENMPELKPATNEGKMPNPTGRMADGFADPPGTYRGDLINKENPLDSVHPGVNNPLHANYPHYNIKLPNGNKAAIIIIGD